jgi:hypothetical protein
LAPPCSNRHPVSHMPRATEASMSVVAIGNGAPSIHVSANHKSRERRSRALRRGNSPPARPRAG